MKEKAPKLLPGIKAGISKRGYRKHEEAPQISLARAPWEKDDSDNERC